jgi:MOSC domain-containing protein YiiM
MSSRQTVADGVATVAADELTEGLAAICKSPKDRGTLELIVARPVEGERFCPERAELTPEAGLVGDRWRKTSWVKLPDGSPDPVVQITLMNVRCISLIIGERNQWAIAGDNLFVDLDLSKENLPAGTRLKVGQCVLEITRKPHNGCFKFKRRFGAAALKFVNSKEGKSLRLRGVHARVIVGGTISVGDRIEKLSAGNYAAKD